MLDSTFKWRERAPFHFLAKADNARFCAYTLSHLSKKIQQDLKEPAEYGGATNIGLGEGYLREACLSIELILKAIIALRREIENSDIGIPKHHVVPKLWAEAKLPKLDTLDQLRLRQFQEVLEWSGRYATPKTEEQFLKDSEETMPPPIDPDSKLKMYKPISLGWEHYDRIYYIAAKRFWEMQNSRGY